MSIGWDGLEEDDNQGSAEVPSSILKKPKRKVRVSFKGDGRNGTEFNDLKKKNDDLQRRLEVALKNVDDLKFMLVKSFSDKKKKRKDTWDDSARVKKVCRDVLWKDVKFAPNSAFVQFGNNSIFKRVIDHCNLPEDMDQIVFWGKNRDVVKSSLNEHRSNVTSRIKNNFKRGELF